MTKQKECQGCERCRNNQGLFAIYEGMKGLIEGMKGLIICILLFSPILIGLWIGINWNTLVSELQSAVPVFMIAFIAGLMCLQAVILLMLFNMNGGDSS